MIFSQNLSLYSTLLLNYCSAPMVTVYFSSRSDCNVPLRTKRCCSNDLIFIIESITLVNARDLAHSDYWEVLPSIWKQRYYFPDGGKFDGVVKVEERFWRRRGWILGWTGVVVVGLSGISGVMWFFSIVCKRLCVIMIIGVSISLSCVR